MDNAQKSLLDIAMRDLQVAVTSTATAIDTLTEHNQNSVRVPVEALENVNSLLQTLMLMTKGFHAENIELRNTLNMLLEQQMK